MKQEIINKATDLFLSLGFKSVTMDDIANNLGMSKKTIYTYFDNKSCLVEAGTSHLFKKITDGIKNIFISWSSLIGSNDLVLISLIPSVIFLNK